MAASGLWIEVSEKLISSWLERTDINGDLSSAGHHLFAPEIGTLEFFGSLIVIFHCQRDLLTGRNLEFRRFKPVVLDRESVGWLLCRSGSRNREDQGVPQQRSACHGISGKRRMRLSRIN